MSTRLLPQQRQTAEHFRRVVDLKTLRRLSLATLLTGAGYDLENSAAIGHSAVCGTAPSLVDTCTTKTLTKRIFLNSRSPNAFGLQKTEYINI